MSFLGVKVILFWVIPLIIKEKSNASALPVRVMRRPCDRYEHVHRPLRDDIEAFLPDFHLVFIKFPPCFY